MHMHLKSAICWLFFAEEYFGPKALVHRGTWREFWYTLWHDD